VADVTDLRIDIASEFTGAKAFKDADSAAAKLERTVKNLAKTVGVALTAQALGRFAKDSLKAFLDDEAAANKLSLAVKNLGMEFANPYISTYISQLEQTAKVADDELRPAFQSLLQQTGSLAKAQSILNTAIETSRGSTYDLGTVANDLAQAYVGNTKGLKKYYLGLDAAALKAASFTEIQELMNKQFTGSNTAYLATYSGQVGVLSLAWGNFQEKVGGTLLTLASFGDGSDGAKLNILAVTLEKIGSAIELIGKGKEAVFGLLDITGKNGLLSKFNPYQTGSTNQPDDSPKVLTKFEKELAKIEKDRLKLNAAIIKQQKALTAEQKKAALLKKTQGVFDLEQIQIMAAMQGKLTAEEQIRLKLQLALLLGNAEQAKALTIELANSEGKSKELAAFLRNLPDAKNPFEAWMSYLDAIQNKIRQIEISTPVAGFSMGGGSGYEVPTNPYAGTYYGETGRDPMPVNIVISTTDQFASALRYDLLDNSLSGKQSAVDRNLGSF